MCDRKCRNCDVIIHALSELIKIASLAKSKSNEMVQIRELASAARKQIAKILEDQKKLKGRRVSQRTKLEAKK